MIASNLQEQKWGGGGLNGGRDSVGFYKNIVSSRNLQEFLKFSLNGPLVNDKTMTFLGTMRNTQNFLKIPPNQNKAINKNRPDLTK